MTPRLAWVPEFMASVNRATGGQFRSFTVISGADPLKAYVKFDLNEGLAGNDYHPFSHLARSFAKTNDCLLERVHRGDSSLTLEVLLKRRLGSLMNKNPLLAKKPVR